MGFFDNLLSRSAGIDQLSPSESYAGLLLALAAADGHISDEEINDLSSLLTKSKLVQNAQGSSLERPLKILRKESVARLVELSAACLPQQYRQSAFACVCDLAFSDGEVAGEEQTMLEQLKSSLEIDDATARKIIDVIVMKNSI